MSIFFLLQGIILDLNNPYPSIWNFIQNKLNQIDWGINLHEWKISIRILTDYLFACNRAELLTAGFKGVSEKISCIRVFKHQNAKLKSADYSVQVT